MSTPAAYIKGDWHATCDSCGMVFLASRLKKRWDGLMVCPKDWEQRHPQDFVRATVDIQAVPWSRPEATDSFTSTLPYAWIAGIALAGAMVGGLRAGPDPIPSGTFTP